MNGWEIEQKESWLVVILLRQIGSILWGRAEAYFSTGAEAYFSTFCAFSHSFLFLFAFM